VTRGPPVLVERPEPVGDVGKVGTAAGYPAEQLPGPGRGARPLVEVRQCIGAPQVMVTRPLGNRPATLELTHRIGHATLVCQGTGSHEATLGHKCSTRRRVAQFGPEHLDIGPPALGPVAVGQHRVLLGAAGQVPEDLEPLCGGLPVSDPVVGEAKELDHLDHLGSTLDQRVQDASGVVEALVVEGPCRLPQLGRRT